MRELHRGEQPQPDNYGQAMQHTLLPIVPVLSSAARMPFPGAAIARAVRISSSAYLVGKLFPKGAVKDAIAIDWLI